MNDGVFGGNHPPAVKGYGERMVKSLMTALPDDWEACVVMDYSEGFWERMAEKYDRIEN